MEENKLIESKKILTDYMLELNRDIQSAEDWANTGADEEMYFALQTVLNELERLQEENEILKEELEKIDKTLNIEVGTNAPYRNDIIEGLKKCVTQFKKKLDDSIPKQVIRDKIQEITNKTDDLETLTYHLKIEPLKELLGE